MALRFEISFAFSVFWQANKVWSSEEECPQHSFFIGKKSKNQQMPAAQTTVQTQNKVRATTECCLWGKLRMGGGPLDLWKIL